MLTAQDELRGAGFVFTMLRKCFGEDFDGKATCAKVAFTKDFRVSVGRLTEADCITHRSFEIECRVRSAQ